MKSRKPIIYGVVIIAIIMFLSLYFYNENREKDLTEVMNYRSSDFESINFKFQAHDDWSDDDEDSARELIDFLSQYRVKKMNDSWWDGDVSKETGFELTIHATENIPLMGSIFGERLLDYTTGDAYKVVNGPIDMEWIERYNEKTRTGLGQES